MKDYNSDVNMLLDDISFLQRQIRLINWEIDQIIMTPIEERSRGSINRISYLISQRHLIQKDIDFCKETLSGINEEENILFAQEVLEKITKEM